MAQQSDNSLTWIKETMRGEIESFHQSMTTHLSSDTQSIIDISEHIINSGGKKIRPILLMAVALSCGYRGGSHADLATMIELIHVATLLHDDVVDNTSLRRGRKTANVLFGNAETILVGDFLYTRAFQIMVSIKRLDILEIMAKATNATAEGEVMQLVYCGNYETTEEQYMAIIDRKTAQLFSAAAEVGATIADASLDERRNWAQFGHQLGIVFQLIDDILDYTTSSEVSGKDSGNDFSEGKMTLPLIHLLNHASDDEKTTIYAMLNRKQEIDMSFVTQKMTQYGSINYVLDQAKTLADQSKLLLENVFDSQFKLILLKLLSFSLYRSQ